MCSSTSRVSHALHPSPTGRLRTLSDAEYVPALSTFSDLGEGQDALGRSRAIVNYARQYLHTLALGGYHIVHSVPVFSRGTSSTSPLTSVTCQVVSRHDIDVRNCLQRRKSADPPVIAVLGTCHNRPLSSSRLDADSLWVIRRRAQGLSGTACFSREAFLEGRVLHALSNINASTTLVANYVGVIEGEWQCDVSLWNAHEYRKGTESRWKLQADQPAGYITYEWQHRDDRAHKHEGSYDNNLASEGESRLTCAYTLTVSSASLQLTKQV